MGLFDSVFVECPWCQKLTEIQSKAGQCSLLTYEESHTPTGICADLSGFQDRCDECKKPITIQSSVPLYGRVWAEKA